MNVSLVGTTHCVSKEIVSKITETEVFLNARLAAASFLARMHNKSAEL